MYVCMYICIIGLLQIMFFMLLHYSCGGVILTPWLFSFRVPRVPRVPAGEARLEEWHRRWRSWLRHCLTTLWLGPKIQRPWEILDGWQLKVFASPKLRVFGTLYQENDGFYPIWMADISAHVTYCTHLHCGLRLQHPRIQRHVSIHAEC